MRTTHCVSWVICRSLRSWPRMGLASSRSGQLVAQFQERCKLQLSSFVAHLEKPALVPGCT